MQIVNGHYYTANTTPEQIKRIEIERFNDEQLEKSVSHIVKVLNYDEGSNELYKFIDMNTMEEVY